MAQLRRNTNMNSKSSHKMQSSSSEMSSQRSYRKRVSKACDCCRKSKSKCDGMRPCSRCLQDNKICTYMINDKKKTDRSYPSSYVDMLETRISILIQSMNQLLETSKDAEMTKKFINEPMLYNKLGKLDLNRVICKLLSPKKIQNLSQANDNYSIDEITDFTKKYHDSSASSTISSTNTSVQTPSNLPISRRHYSDSSLYRSSQSNYSAHKPSFSQPILLSSSVTESSSTNDPRHHTSINTASGFSSQYIDDKVSLTSPVSALVECLNDIPTTDNGSIVSKSSYQEPCPQSSEFRWDNYELELVQDELQMILEDGFSID